LYAASNQLRVMKLVYDDTVRMNELNSAHTLCQREKIMQQSDFTPKYDFVTGIGHLSLPLSEAPCALGTINPRGGEDIKAGYYMTPDYNDEYLNEEGHLICPATEKDRYGVAFGDLNHDQYRGAIVNIAHLGPVLPVVQAPSSLLDTARVKNYGF